MRVLIADKQTVARRALKILLSTRPELDVVGEAANEKDLMEQVKVTQPDLVLLDENIVGEQLDDSFEALRRLDVSPAVIVLSTDPDLEETALAVGADAFVLKLTPPRQLLIAIETIRLK